MKRLGDNIYRYSLHFLPSWQVEAGIVLGPLVPVMLILFPLFNFGYDDSPVPFVLLCLVICLPWFILVIKNLLNGVVLNFDKGVISYAKWNWKFWTEPKRVDIQIAEVLSVSGDTDVEITTNNKGTTRVFQYHNLVLHGSFGSKRLRFFNLDDINSFQTLLSGGNKK